MHTYYDTCCTTLITTRRTTQTVDGHRATRSKRCGYCQPDLSSFNQPAASRNCSASRTQRHESFSGYRGSHLLNHCWKSYTGYRFANALTTSWPYWRTRSETHQLLHTSAITSDLVNPHVTSVLQPHHYSTDRLPELTSPTARSVAPLLPSGTLWTLILCAATL